MWWCKSVTITAEGFMGQTLDASAMTGDLARRHGLSEATIYDWKAKYGRLEVSEARRLREL
jgi:putative transposase